MPDTISIFRSYLNLLFLCFLFLFWGCAQKLVPQSPGLVESMPADSGAPTQLPYDVNGQTYHPLSDVEGFAEEGIASWYGKDFHGRQTSNQEVYNMYALTAAHKTLPFHTKVKVTHQSNGKQIVVRINDRGPFVDDRIIDLSYAAAQALGMEATGTAPVHIEVLGSDYVEPESAEIDTVETQTVSLEPQTQVAETYSIQVGLFINREYAERLSRSHQGRVQTLKMGDEEYYRVLVGSYAQYEAALGDREKLRRQGREDAFIIRVQGP